MKKRIFFSIGLTLLAILTCSIIFLPKLTVSSDSQNKHLSSRQTAESQSKGEKISYSMIPTLSVEDFVGTSNASITAKIDVISCQKIKAPLKLPAYIHDSTLYDADLFTVKLTKVYKGRASNGDTVQIIRYSDRAVNQQEGAKLLAVGQKGYANIYVFKDDEYPQINGTNGFIPIDGNGNLSTNVTQTALMFRNNQLHVYSDKKDSSYLTLDSSNKTDKVFSNQTFENALTQITNKKAA
jgi:hypothetical protein